jgi:hypothetical protein
MIIHACIVIKYPLVGQRKTEERKKTSQDIFHLRPSPRLPISKRQGKVWVLASLLRS